MKKHLLSFFILFLFAKINFAQQWAKTTNGTGNGMDAVTAMVVDKAGNVYATGYVYNGTASDNDYVTIKYNTNGVQQWLAKYNGPGSGSDIPKSIFVDANGNVYVTGTSDALTGAFINNDVATVKYNSAGVQQWVARYDGALQRDDAGNAVKVDASGNVYVTGYTTFKPLGLKKEYLTIKYNASGVQQWLQTFSGPGKTNGRDDVAVGLALDAASNVYVTGYIFAASSGYSGQNDYLTIKYNSAGVRQWTQQYNGPGNSFDMPTAIAADAAGNVVVTGYSDGIDLDFATIKYNTNGVQQWLSRYNGPANSADLAYALALDNAGNVYVTGSDQKTIYNSDFLTVKYSPNGVQQWTARYNGPANDNDESYAIAVDKSGNVFVTGYINGTSPGWDIATVKYNSAGAQQWVSRYDGAKDSADVGNAIGVDTLGNVYVGGATTGKKTAWDYTVLKYNSTGTLAKTASLEEMSSVATEDAGAQSFGMFQNYPNPFSATTKIKFVIPSTVNTAGVKVKLVVYDITGREAATLVDAVLQSGEHEYQWNATGSKAGIYFCRLSAGNRNEVKKLVLIK